MLLTKIKINLRYKPHAHLESYLLFYSLLSPFQAQYNFFTYKLIMAQTDLVCSKCVGRRTVNNIMMKVNSKVMVRTVLPYWPLAYTRWPTFVSVSVHMCICTYAHKYTCNTFLFISKVHYIYYTCLKIYRCPHKSGMYKKCKLYTQCMSIL
jgi:hypothetical protein